MENFLLPNEDNRTIMAIKIIIKAIIIDAEKNIIINTITATQDSSILLIIGIVLFILKNITIPIKSAI